MRNRYTVVFQQIESGKYVAYAEELPGACTQADTMEEARESIKRAIAFLCEANRHALLQRLPLRRFTREYVEVDHLDSLAVSPNADERK